MPTNSATADPMLDLLEDAEWTAPQGRPQKLSPYLGIVKKAQEDDKAYAIKVSLNGKTVDEQFKDRDKHVLLFRKAGSQLDTPATVLVQCGEVDPRTGEVKITFKVREKITRKRSQEAVESTPNTKDNK